MCWLVIIVWQLAISEAYTLPLINEEDYETLGHSNDCLDNFGSAILVFEIWKQVFLEVCWLSAHMTLYTSNVKKELNTENTDWDKLIRLSKGDMHFRDSLIFHTVTNSTEITENVFRYVVYREHRILRCNALLWFWSGASWCSQRSLMVAWSEQFLYARQDPVIADSN